MTFPLSDKDIPVQDGVVYCAICGRGGDPESVSMMRLNHATLLGSTIWLHSDICFNKWFLHTEEQA